MGKIFDALNKAEKDQGAPSPEASDFEADWQKRLTKSGAAPDLSVLSGKDSAPDASEEKASPGSEKNSGLTPPDDNAPSAGPRGRSWTIW